MKIMKDSGIEWIKEIPVSWNVLRGKNILNIHKRAYSNDCEVVTCFRDGQVTLRSNRREEGFTFADKEIGYQGVEVGDLVIHGMDGFAGAIGISDSDGKASPVLNVCTPKQSYSTKFLMYYLRMLANQNVFIALATGIRERSCDLRWNKIAELLFPVTTEMEQTAIADYLDDKCGKIYATIEREKQHIEKLKEYRQAVITEAVTKGLDPTVPMKDSGVEWIGEVPQGWGIARLKHTLKNGKGAIRVGPFGSQLRENKNLTKGYAIYNQRTVLDNDFESGESYIDEEVFDNLINFKLEPLDVIITTRGTIGKIAIAPTNLKDGIIHSCIIKFTLNRNIIQDRYLTYIFNDTGISLEQLILASNATTIPVVYSEPLKNVYLSFPSLQEQTSITDYLDCKTAQIDSAIAKKETLIEKLTEYKKSLIYEAVTGKVEVSK